jgi:hypothetical protein
MPNIQILYRNAKNISFAARSATNSLPKLVDLTVFCRFENQIIGAFWMYKIIPVCDRQVITLTA